MVQPARIFRVFVSSTFSDMVAERNALQKHVYPKLRDFCTSREARFQAIDLRWGISQEAGLNQRATDVCLKEIARCQRTTKRPNFLLLMGDRYGWQPLPNNIPAEEWDILSFCIRDKESKVLLDTWYRRDDNTVPSIYVLQPRTGKYVEQNTWDKIEAMLQDSLRRALEGLDWPREKRMKYETSVTEQEIEAGIFQYDHSQEAAFCFFRTIDDLPADAKSYTDFTNEADKKLANLKQRIEAHLPNDNIHHYRERWEHGSISFNEETFCQAVEGKLKQAIEAELAAFGTISPLEVEQEAHRIFLAAHTRHFVGRIDALEKVSNYLHEPPIQQKQSPKQSFLDKLLSRNKPQEAKNEQPIDNLPFVLYGQSGVGKSTVMAKAVEQAGDVLYHFIGITPESSDIRSMLVNLCEAIRVRYSITDEIPQDYEELIKIFPSFLAHAYAEKPLIIFLDALDQLAKSDTPSNLRWLPNTLPPHVKLVMSAVPSPHLDTLQNRLPFQNTYEIEPMQIVDGETLLDLLLHDAKSTLQARQRAEVLNKFAQSGLPLYLKLAFEEAKLWRSYQEPIALQPDVPSLIEHNLFARLSDNTEHGMMLISRSLAYIQAARHGLSENEILHVLTQDLEFWADFEERSHEAQRAVLKIVRQLPIAVWSRLLFDLEPYMVERGEDGEVLLDFYHRQFSETVDNLYLAPKREVRHTHLAHYFETQPLYIEGKPNTRKVSEQAYQQAKANLHDAYVTTLTNYPFLQVSLDLRGVQALIEDCGLRDDNTVRLIQSALSMSTHILAKHPDQLPSHLFARLMSYRHKNTEITNLLNAGETKLALFSICETMQAAGGALLRVLQGHLGSVIAMAFSGDVAVSASADHTLNVWNWKTGELLRVLKGHTGAVNGVVLFGDYAISTSGDSLFDGHHYMSDKTLRVWNWKTGKLLHTLEGHTDALTKVALSGDYAVSASWDHTLRVWNWKTGKLLHTLEGHTDRVIDVVLSGDFAVSASWDHTLRVWNWKTGKLLHTLEGHTSSLTAIALSGDFVVSASRDDTLRVWNWKAGKLLHTLVGHAGPLNAIALSGDYLVSASEDYTLRVWNWKTGEALQRFEGHISSVNAVALFDNYVVSASQDHTLRVWNLFKWKDVNLPASVMEEWQRRSKWHTDTINDVALCEDYAVSASQDHTLRVWNWKTGDLLHTLEGHVSGIKQIKIQGDYVLSASEYGSMAPIALSSEDSETRQRILRMGVWNWKTGELVHPLEGHTGSVNEVVLSDNYAVTASGLSPTFGHRLDKYAVPDNALRVWNWKTGDLLHTLEGHTASVTAVALSGDYAVSASLDCTLRVWDWKTGSLLRTLEESAVDNNIAFSLDHENKVALAGDYAICTSWQDNALRIWNWKAGKLLRKLEGHTAQAATLALSGDYAVSASWDNSVRVWNWKTGDLLRVLEGHTNAATALALSGDYAVSASWDNSVRVWNWKTGECLAVFTMDSPQFAVAIAPDWKCIVSGGVSRLYSLRPSAALMEMIRSH